MGWIILIIAIIVFLIWANNRSKNNRLEEAILQADKSNQYDSLLRFCDENGISEEKRIKVARKMYFRMAEQDDVFALGMAAVYAESKEAQCTYYKRAAQLGDVEAMYTLGLKYQHFDDKELVKSMCFADDPKQSFSWFKKAADKGHYKAQAAVASAMYFGDGVTKDEEKAFAYAKNCSDRGNAECSIFLVDYFYRDISGTHFNIPEAIRLLKRVMSKGDKEIFSKAADELGYIYGRAYIYGGSEDEYSDRYKAAYFYALAYFSGDYSADNISKTGYRATDFELQKWREDAINMKCTI